MTEMSSEEEPPTPWEIRSKTNYGATGLIQNIQEQSKQRARRQQGMASILNSIRRMNSAPTPRNWSPGRRSYTPDRSGAKSQGFNVQTGDKLSALMWAIGNQESGNNYSAVNADSGAAGKYQIMPGNFVGPGGWDKEALGRDIRLGFYMKHPRAQERMAKHMLGNYLRQYGPRGAMQAWYGGPGAVGNDDISGGSGYPTTGSYADTVMQSYLRRLRRLRR